MLYFIAIILISLTQAQYGYEYLAEWQTGVDKTINKQAEFTNPQFPIRQYTRVVFPRRFSDRPKVLLMHEEIQWSKGRNINYQTYVSDITINGFYINYVIQGPATVPILTVRWVAIVDPNAEIQYVHYQSDDLYYLRQGFGFRAQDFMISYYPRYPAPKVTAFIVGADFEIFDSIYTSIAIQMDIPNTSSMNVRFSTRDFCHVRSLLIAYFITNNHLTLAGSVASQHNFYNQYLDNSNKNTIRVQKFTRLVPSIYSIEPAYNILAQGISGFDVSSHYSSTYLRVTAEYMSQYSSAYTLLYGTRGETLMSYMQASYVLHPPGLPYHYYYKNYDWVVTKGDQIVIEETVAQEQKISDLKKY